MLIRWSSLLSQFGLLLPLFDHLKLGVSILLSLKLVGSVCKHFVLSCVISGFVRKVKFQILHILRELTGIVEKGFKLKHVVI